MTVNIVTPPSSPRLAAPATRDDNVIGDETYRDGDPEEQRVNSIRFFFFDEGDNAAPVSAVSNDGGAPTTYVSYIDWVHLDNTLGEAIDTLTVEATLTATLGLKIPDGIDAPTQLIAVINPPSSVTSLAADNEYGPSKTTVAQAIANYEDGLTSANFVMTNSVYVDTNADPAEATTATSLVAPNGKPSYFQNSIEAAQANPVIIYVERVVSRLDLYIGLNTLNTETANGYTLYPVMKKVEGGADIQASININGVETPIYVQFLGWNVTSTPSKSYLVKMIDTSWTSQGIFGSTTPWTTMDYHRSFWAMNPPLAETDYQYGNFNGAASATNPQPAKSLDIPQPGEYTKVYMQENASEFNATPGAAPTAPLHPSQVILAARLVDKTGTPIQLAEWAYNKYTQPDLLNYLVANIISKGNFYKKSGNSYTSLGTGDLKFISASDRFPGGLPADVHRYYSYIVLNPDADNDNWYIKNGDGDPSDVNMVKTTEENINNFLLNNVGYTMMWESGYTYYYFDIKHLGAENSKGFYGVVRNHLYEATVTSLYGFGTPVCNPDEIIIPETPQYEEVLLTAEIRLLQWRVVKSDYSLDWR